MTDARDLAISRKLQKLMRRVEQLVIWKAGIPSIPPHEKQ